MPTDHVPPDGVPDEEERLLPQDNHLAELGSVDLLQNSQINRERGLLEEEANQLEQSTTNSTFQLTAGALGGPIEYKVYKRRWLGLGQLILLNIVVSWDVSD